MNERNEQMAALLTTEAPAARDLAFEIAVMTRIEARRYRRGVTMNITLAIAASLLLALVMPQVEATWTQSFAGLFSNASLAALLFAATLSLQWWLTRRT